MQEDAESIGSLETLDRHCQVCLPDPHSSGCRQSIEVEEHMKDGCFCRVPRFTVYGERLRHFCDLPALHSLSQLSHLLRPETYPCLHQMLHRVTNLCDIKLPESSDDPTSTLNITASNPKS